MPLVRDYMPDEPEDPHTPETCETCRAEYEAEMDREREEVQRYMASQGGMTDG